MTPRSFFTILIKILGLYLVLQSLTIVPQFIGMLFTFSSTNGNSAEIIALTSFLALLTLGIYYFILRYCIFKTEWVIDKLHLENGFSEEKFELNIHRSTVLRISIIVFGGLIFVDGLPIFCRSVYTYIGQKQTFQRFGENPEIGWMIFYFMKTFIGFLLLTNSRLVLSFIERQRKKQ